MLVWLCVMCVKLVTSMSSVVNSSIMSSSVPLPAAGWWPLRCACDELQHRCDDGNVDYCTTNSTVRTSPVVPYALFYNTNINDNLIYIISSTSCVTVQREEGEMYHSLETDRNLVLVSAPKPTGNAVSFCFRFQ